MSTRPGVCALALAIAAGAPGPAAGAPTAAQVSVAASSGYTDNALGVASDPPEGTAGPAADVYFTVSPEVTLWRDTPRLVLTGTAGVSVSRYVDETQANALDVHASLRAAHDLAPTLRGTWTLSGSYRDVAALEPEGIVGAVPTGGAKLVTVGTTAGLAKELSKSWRIVNDARLSWTKPVEDGSGGAVQRESVTVGNAIGAQYSFKRDALDGRLDVAANHYAAVEGDPLGAVTDFTVGATGSWLHELDRFWALTLSGGATFARVREETALAPLARIAIARTTDKLVFKVTASHGVQPNLLLAETLSTTEGTVSVQVVMGERWRAQASAGAANARNIGGGVSPDINSLRSSARVDFTLRDNFALSLSHELLYQVNDSAMAGAESTKMLRNNVVLGLTGYWPAKQPRVVVPESGTLRVRQSEELEQAEREGTRADEE